MYRLDRKFTNVGITCIGNLFSLMDGAIKESFRINDDEYEYLLNEITDEELDIIFKDENSFSNKRESILILDKYIKKHTCEGLLGSKPRLNAPDKLR